jgi:tRNA uracil 4-sulfurtransferase
VDEVADLPVLRPLIGMDKLEITAQAEAIDTFGISIEPDADCCTLFVPKNPGTRASREEIDAVESRLDVAGLVEMGVAGAELETFDFPLGAGPMRPPSAAARGGAGRR